MTSIKEFTQILQLLSEDDKPLEQTASHFYRLWPKTDYFQVATYISILIRDEKNFLFEKVKSEETSRSPQETAELSKLETSAIPSASYPHKIIGFYILFDLYKNDTVANNPFLPAIIDQLSCITQKHSKNWESNSNPPSQSILPPKMVKDQFKAFHEPLRQFLSCLLNNQNIKEFSKKSARELLDHLSSNPLKLNFPALHNLKRTYLEKQISLKHPFRNLAMSPIILEEREDFGFLEKEMNKEDHDFIREKKFELFEELADLKGFEPQFVRPPPAIFESKDEDVNLWNHFSKIEYYQTELNLKVD